MAPTRALWQEAVLFISRGQNRRADWQRHLAALAWQLMLRSGTSMTTLPKRGATWAVLAEEIGISRRTLAYLLAWMRRHGLLVVAESGSICRYRRDTLCGLLDDGLGNRAAEYVLTLPVALLATDDSDTTVEELLEDAYTHLDDYDGHERDAYGVPWPVPTLRRRPTADATSVQVSEPASAPVDITCTPTPAPGSSIARSLPYPRTREEMSDSTSRQTSWSATATPGTKKEILSACERLRADDLLLAQMTAHQLRALLRPLWGHGATVRDVQAVINQRPDGTRWTTATADVRWLPGLLRYRVGAWLDDHGQLLAPLPSQHSAAAATRTRAEQEHRRAEQSDRQAHTGDAAGGAAAVRAALVATSAGTAAMERYATRRAPTARRLTSTAAVALDLKTA